MAHFVHHGRGDLMKLILSSSRESQVVSSLKSTFFQMALEVSFAEKNIETICGFGSKPRLRKNGGEIHSSS